MKQSSSIGSIIGVVGMILAVVISYAKWHSILWAVIHGLCGWLYVIYFAFTR